MTDPVVITGIARTPMGAFKGAFADVAAPDLGAVAIRAAMSEANVAADAVEQVVMGCVLPAGPSPSASGSPWCGSAESGGGCHRQ